MPERMCELQNWHDIGRMSYQEPARPVQWRVFWDTRCGCETTVAICDYCAQRIMVTPNATTCSVCGQRTAEPFRNIVGQLVRIAGGSNAPDV